MDGFRYSINNMKRHRKLTSGRTQEQTISKLWASGAINIEGVKQSRINEECARIRNEFGIVKGQLVAVYGLKERINKISNRILRREVYKQISKQVPLSKYGIWV